MLAEDVYHSDGTLRILWNEKVGRDSGTYLFMTHLQAAGQGTIVIFTIDSINSIGIISLFNW